MASGGLTGILLVGGASRRFGSPKAFAVFDNETLAQRGWRLLGEICDERIAVGRVGEGAELPFPILADGLDQRAPLVGVVAGLRAASNDVCVVLPVDAPLVSLEMLRSLVDAGGDVAVSQTGPLPGVYHRSALPVLEERLAAGELKLSAALERLDTRIVDLDPFLLVNVNTVSDLRVASRRERAIAAAVDVARAQALEAGGARILQDWNDTIVHLAPTPLVARVRTTWIEGSDRSTFEREVAVAMHVAARDGPVVPPSRAVPPGPYAVDGLVVTLWEYVEQTPGDVAPQELGHALRGLHAALEDYPGQLPPLTERLERAQAVIDDPGAVWTLPEESRRFLSRTFRDLRDRARDFALAERVLHGGAHGGNLLSTRRGLLWIDLDTVCRGPLEWDLAHLPHALVADFPEADVDALALYRLLVSADVAIWCWHTYGRAPEVDAAAMFHLDRLRAALGEVRIIPYDQSYVDRYRRLVEETLREFGFEPDPVMDPDLDDPTTLFAKTWIAVAQGDVVGSVALRDLGEGALELKRMYLRPGCRGGGLGKKLLATALDWARSHDARLVKLDTSERMEAARRLYEAHGFRRVPGDAPRQGQCRLLYELRLS